MTILNTKYSYHIIINDYYFSDNVMMKEYSRMIKVKMSDRYKYLKDCRESYVIDLSVYKRSQSFRLVNNCKLGSNRILKIEDDSDLEDTYLTKIFYDYIQPLQYKYSLDNKIKKSIRKDIEDVKDRCDNVIFHCPYTYEQVKIMLMSLDIKRSYDYELWLYVLFVIYSLGEQYHKLSHTFSKRCKEKYNKEHINYILSNIRYTGYTYKSLLYWLKEDLKDDYMDFMIENNVRLYDHRDDHIIKMYNDYLYQDEYGLSLIYVHEQKNNIKMDDNNGYLWNDDNKLWEYRTKSYIENNTVVITLQNVINIINEHYEFKYHNDVSNKKYQEWMTLKSTVSKSINKRRTISNIFSLSKTHNDIYDIKFSSKLNRMKGILPINNNKCVILSEYRIRDRCREDMFSFHINVNWKIKYDRTFINTEFIGKMFCHNTSVIRYLQKIIGYSFTGENNEKIFINIYGTQNNNKSGLDKAIRAVSGDFSCVLPREIIQKNTVSKSSHTSYLDKIKNGERYGSLCEISDDDRIRELNSELIKKISGCDDIDGKSCNASERYTFTPSTIIFIYTNPKLKMNISDKALLSRLLIFKAEGTFTDNKDILDDSKHIYLVDKFFSDRMKDYYDDFFMWICRGAYRYYKEGLSDIPKKLIDDKNEYLSDITNVIEFIETNMIHINELPSKLCSTTTHVFNAYKSFAGNDIDPHFKDILKDKLGTPIKCSSYIFKNYILRKELEDYISHLEDDIYIPKHIKYSSKPELYTELLKTYDNDDKNIKNVKEILKYINYIHD